MSSTELSTAPSGWPVWIGRADLPSDGSATTLTDIPAGGDPTRFFAVLEKDLPPPPALLEEGFEDDDGGFAATAPGAGTAWAHGTPTSSDDGGIPNPGGSVTSGNGGAGKCWGTGIGNPITSGSFPLTVTDDLDTAADWKDAGPYALPVGGEIRIEWCFSGTGGIDDDYMGWDIDDVVVTETTP